MLEQTSIQELSAAELEEVSGGISWMAAARVAVSDTVAKWRFIHWRGQSPVDMSAPSSFLTWPYQQQSYQ